jgi:hypothetical protein
MGVPAKFPATHVAGAKANKVAWKMIPTDGDLSGDQRALAAAILARLITCADLSFSVRIFIRG